MPATFFLFSFSTPSPMQRPVIILTTLTLLLLAVACSNKERMRSVLDEAERHNQNYESMAGGTKKREVFCRRLPRGL